MYECQYENEYKFGYEISGCNIWYELKHELKYELLCANPGMNFSTKTSTKLGTTCTGTIVDTN